MTPGPDDRDVLAGYAWMALAVLIWAGWLVLTSSGRTTALSVVDLAGLRALIPAVLLAPLLWHQRAKVRQLGLLRCLTLTAYGAPFTICVGYGLKFAPVAHAGALVPGLMPVMAALLGLVFLGQRLVRRQMLSIALILTGAMAILAHTRIAPGTDQLLTGHVLFLAGAVCWASFTVTMRNSDISPYLAIGVVGTLSSVVLVPVWVLGDLSNIRAAGLPDIAFQAMFQGVLSGLVSLFAFGRALHLLGARAAALSALVPGTAALMAIPVLGQWPGLVEVLALIVVIAGLVIGATGSAQARAVGQAARMSREQRHEP
ncbi:drug/metabolite transporter (DMT)-like permease [Rubricella aquisinus]|uniref:Drug/metabolite transporter (DMT)-like permease n=1 Tax=Rubricella aquisinus TaxID=2028108 RepID=A0A840WPQ0_9RHOB|nr:DMT family transporter [Rubricella aquisinus]MBB5515622.1 drug/metabolite transporter (DMT)-like permease [Rubricella aquisinus]